jgi:hypothetical protein
MPEISAFSARQPTPMHPARLPTESLLGACEVRRQRRSGPGGQHRNKVETAVVLVHLPSGIRAEATERRSQAENQRVAIQRLRIKLALQLRSSAHELVDSPSPLWRSRAKGRGIAVSASHADFASLLAEALDAFAACDFDSKKAAEQLGCSPSQLIKLIKQAPEALLQVNEQRKLRGLHALR